MNTLASIAYWLGFPIRSLGGLIGAWPNLLLWSVGAGLVALLVYQRLSPQETIRSAKEAIKGHLLAIRLYQHDLGMVLRSTARVLFHNGRYLTANLGPLVILTVPMVFIMAALVVSHAFQGLPVGQTLVAKVSTPDPHALRLAESDDYQVIGRPLRSPEGFVAWRLRFAHAGEMPLRLSSGDEEFGFPVRVGEPGLQAPIYTAQGTDSILYPTGVLPSQTLVDRIEFSDIEPTLFGPLPAGELGVVLLFVLVSLGTGLLFKNQFGVVL